MITRTSHIEGYMTAEGNKEGGIAGTVAANGTIYFSGLAAIGPDYEVVAPGDMAGQLEFCMELLERGLAQHDADLSNLVSVVFYVTDEEAFMEAYGPISQRFVDHPIATTTIGIPGLAMKGLVVELVPIAAI